MKRLLSVLFVLACVAVRLAAEEELNVNIDLALDPAKASPDFKIQGEYSGEITTADGKKKFGAQVMALGRPQYRGEETIGADGKKKPGKIFLKPGGGTFRVVYYYGGLPGDGWQGDAKLRVITAKEWVPDGQTEGDKTVFQTPYPATLSGETISGKNDKGEAFECKKVMRQSPTMGAKAPEGSVVLFDGSNLDQWKGGLHIDERKLIATDHGGGETKQKFQAFTLHVEYMEPFKPYGREQDRGNSGVYMQNRYECQVLDSFGRFGKNNEAGGIYTIAAPKLNMVFPPLSWQTYDIDFTPAKFEDGKKVKNAYCTIKHNGVVIHENQEIKGKTGGGKDETADGGEIQLQGHGNPVFYRNIWILEKK